jgi:hypothetical protein
MFWWRLLLTKTCSRGIGLVSKILWRCLISSLLMIRSSLERRAGGMCVSCGLFLCYLRLCRTWRLIFIRVCWLELIYLIPGYPRLLLFSAVEWEKFLLSEAASVVFFFFFKKKKTMNFYY